MANALKRLLLLGPRRAGPDPSPADEPTVNVDVDALPLEGATSGASSLLVPAAIFRQVLFDPTEFTPTWLRPRPAVAPEPATASRLVVDATAVANAASTDEPKLATRPRRPKAKTPSGASRTRSKRTPKADHGPA